MSVSRRFESRFRFCIAKYNTSTGSFIAKPRVGTSSRNQACSYKATTGLPVSGYAFSGNYVNMYLVAQNRCNSLNAKGLNPATSKTWYDAEWSLVPNDIKIFDNSSTVITSLSESGYSEVTVGIYKYMIGFGFRHQVNIVNNMNESITIEYRGFDKYGFDDNGGGSTLVMTDWIEQTITSGSTFNCALFEPMEIRFDTDNMPSGEDVGIVLQDATTKYLMLG